MSYYQGDYYRGDYYRGDPILGGLIPLVGKVALGFGAKLLGKVAPKLPAVATGVAISAAGRAMTGPGPMRIPLPGPFEARPGAIFPGGRRFIARTECPPGFHLDKKFQEKCVRNRRMDPANPRALRRAIRREQGFVALAKRTLRGTGITIGRRSFGSKRKARR